MLDVKNAMKVFGRGTPVEHTALNNLSLHLDKGEFVCLIGSNGAGKSTLFNAICGTFLLDGGSITLDGRDITFMREYKRAHAIGRVFQDPMVGTAPHMTIAENLSLAYSRSQAWALHFAPDRKQKALFRDKLAAYGMGLEDRMDAKVGLLSGGQRQAVTLLMCTIVPPKLLLLDEHTAALDPAMAEKVMQITREVVAAEGLTTMMITHNMRDALTTGTRTVMMDSGSVLLDLSGEERASLTLDGLLAMYKSRKAEAFDNDRMLL